MAEGAQWSYLLPDSVREMPADLAASLIWVGLTVGAVFLPGINETPIRIVIGLPFLLFIPGYVFIAALFPTAETESQSSRTDDPSDSDGIDLIERLTLSVGTSIAISPLIGLGLNFTPWGIRLSPIVVAVGGFSVVMTFVANRRRRTVPPDERFVLPYKKWGRTLKSELMEPTSTADAVVNVVLVASILLAVGSVGYAIAVPSQGESFSELYLLTEDETGTLVADEYPTEFTQGQSQPLIVGVSNQEHERVDYTLVAELQRVQFVNNSTRVETETELQRFQTSLAHNETRRFQHTVTPSMTGEELRLVYLLYRGPPPAEPTVTNAYREVHLWINVTASEPATRQRTVRSLASPSA